MTTSRLFIAVWPTPGVVAALVEAIAPLMATTGPEVRWLPPERWHVTVLFLGDCSPARRRRAERAVREVAAATPAERVTGRGAGRFRGTLWWRLQADWLAPVHRRLSERLGRPEERAFRPHLTVARVRGAPVSPALVAAFGDLPALSWVPRHLDLVVSTLGPAPRYEPVVRAPFATG